MFRLNKVISSQISKSGNYVSLIKRFQSNNCNTCKCPNSEKINYIQSLVLPTYFLTCGMGGYIIGNIIFTAISIIKRI